MGIIFSLKIKRKYTVFVHILNTTKWESIAAKDLHFQAQAIWGLTVLCHVLLSGQKFQTFLATWQMAKLSIVCGQPISGQ